MTVDELHGHKKTLGILYLVSVALVIILLLFIRVLISMIFGFAAGEVSGEDAVALEFVEMLLMIVPLLIVIFNILPTGIAAIGLLTKQTWAPLLAMIVGCIKLFSFPFGTAMGVYAIWIFSEDQKLKKAEAAR